MPGETDQVRWRGVRPVSGIRGVWPEVNATRVRAWASQDVTGLTIVYTVPAGKKLFINSAFLSTANSAAASRWANLYLRNGADVYMSYVFLHRYFSAGYQTSALAYLPALEAEAGWDVVLEVNDADIVSTGFFLGWLEDA